MEIKELFELLKPYQPEVFEAYLTEKGDLAEWMAENAETITIAKEKEREVASLQVKIDAGKVAEVSLAKVIAPVIIKK